MRFCDIPVVSSNSPIVTFRISKKSTCYLPCGKANVADPSLEEYCIFCVAPPEADFTLGRLEAAASLRKRICDLDSGNIRVYIAARSGFKAPLEFQIANAQD